MGPVSWVVCWCIFKSLCCCFVTRGRKYHLIWPSMWTSSSVQASLVAQILKNLPAMQETQVQSLGREDPLEKGMATHSSILAWRIPWTELPGGLQSMRLWRVGHDRLTHHIARDMLFPTTICVGIKWGIWDFPGGSSGRETTCQCKKRKWHGCNPRKIP